LGVLPDVNVSPLLAPPFFFVELEPVPEALSPFELLVVPLDVPLAEALVWVPVALVLEEPLEALDAPELDLLDPQPATTSNAATQARIVRTLLLQRSCPADRTSWPARERYMVQA
jgi:hypothetical protein